MFDAILGGALNFAGAHMANQANKKMAREQMAFQQESNREQMAFQERLSNTSYQRATEDMRKAGLNPILAYNQGGASSMGGASSAGSSAQMVNELSGAVSSAMEGRRLKYEIDNMKETKKLLENQSWKAGVEADGAEERNYQIHDERKLIQANTAKSLLEAKKTESDIYRSWVDTIGNQLNPLKLFEKVLGK